ncbi:MAG: hypothetical protein A3A94_02400 [Candidatus Portnoybacteria bacterium RIFCSPLOWO2_01_FULL_43_11]|uniref:Uncharacterized protein n=4 Tax=Candidatus Portnoyibacteriota TaxID=1817913 RepID=A0A1G2FB72_9BACT|nr:MAG: hypothetical protein A2815_02445 [Candidatus Portnoybacteria bacterium RIFCSPHIGHO2_01_FULL_40_12b]OGZ38862.1 MAG: hypothetical protein A3A94_02400 [Candidatus Portnoybacteria bacterium RIFCSPLOWO2_01_FULL_43_11]OGZ39450.1 MAG: hypothetical protein A3E90_01630 [Candidatus Portnoybacteria bacterium RIFCSPHIGHO2_12_FULL_40_11]OGZ40524.1 MAG: hypothetical protein A3I20_00555 [Candidatus Portnoybacteria bacterium RIFCSPLOWO2_02_FULL_40_15]
MDFGSSLLDLLSVYIVIGVLFLVIGLLIPRTPLYSDGKQFCMIMGGVVPLAGTIFVLFIFFLQFLQ